MMRQRWSRVVGFPALLLAGIMFSHAAHAGIITNYNGAVGGGTATVNGEYSGPISTLDPNDATEGGAGGVSPNALTVDKTFTKLAPIDMSFHAVDSNGYTSYVLDETVTNNTGFRWTDYHFQLGFGTGANFILAALPSQLTFDPTNPAGTDSFAFGVQTNYTVNWNGPPGVANGGVATFDVQIIIPDTALAKSPYSLPGDTAYDFTLRQFATIPEPSSLVLMGAGGIGLLGFGLRRRKN